MSHVKAGGTTRLGRDSQSKRLGVKKYGGQKVLSGNIVIRQRGTKFRAGKNAMLGKDDTVMATQAGIVSFRAKRVRRFDDSFRETIYVDVLPA